MSCLSSVHIDQAHPSPGPYPLPTLPSSSLHCTSIIYCTLYIFIPLVSTLSILLFSTFVLLHFTFVLHFHFCLAFVFFYFFPCFLHTFPSSLIKHHPSILPLSTLPSFPFLSLLPFFILNGFPSQFLFRFHF